MHTATFRAPAAPWILGTFFTVAFFGSPSHALGAKPVLGLEVTGGWARHDLEEFNRGLEDLNDASGTDFGSIHGGPAFGVSARIWPREWFLIRLGVERLEPSTSSGPFDVSAGALAWTIGGTWFQRTSAPVRLGLGFDLGSYQGFGKLEGPDVRMKTSGSGVGFEGRLELHVPMGDRWSANVRAGYRFADVVSVRFGERTSSIDADYSGATIRLGIAHDWWPRVAGSL